LLCVVVQLRALPLLALHLDAALDVDLDADVDVALDVDAGFSGRGISGCMHPGKGKAGGAVRVLDSVQVEVQDQVFRS
jgi:hypothetical protein